MLAGIYATMPFTPFTRLGDWGYYIRRHAVLISREDTAPAIDVREACRRFSKATGRFRPQRHRPRTLATAAAFTAAELLMAADKALFSIIRCFLMHEKTRPSASFRRRTLMANAAQHASCSRHTALLTSPLADIVIIDAEIVPAFDAFAFFQGAADGEITEKARAHAHTALAPMPA